MLSSFLGGLLSRQNGSRWARFRAAVSSQANPGAGFWVADGIFWALAQGQAGGWIKATLREPGKIVWLVESVSREKWL